MENNTVAPTDYDTLRETAGKTPLVDLLRAIPKDYRAEWTEAEGLRATHLSPVGLYCHEAAEAITQLQAKIERLEGAAKTLGTEAALLLQNSEGCAQNHYGNDCEQFGMPQWLVDSRARIEAARNSLSDKVGG